MKFSCVRSVLQQAVNTAAKAASAKSPIPALEGLLLEAGVGNLKITGYDLKKAIYTRVDADVAEQGSIVLGARIFGDLDDPDCELVKEIAATHAAPIAGDLTKSKVYYVR